MRRREPHLAGAFEKVAVALLVASDVTEASALERFEYRLAAVAAFGVGD